MTRLALAAASLLMGLAIAGPTQAGDISQFMEDFDIEDVEVSEVVPAIRQMVGNPNRAMKGLKEALGEEEELAGVKQMLEDATQDRPKRRSARQTKAQVASSKTVKQNVKEVKSAEPAAAQTSTAKSEPSTARSINCTRFVPSAGTTISIDCDER